MQIKYLAHKDIDKFKWNRCIEETPTGLIYARSFYLDLMGIKWDALILNEYEAVMPLTWNWKYGFYYLYQPYFVPFLGVFGNEITPGIVALFLKSIPRKFKYWNIDLNETNYVDKPELTGLVSIRERTNYYLSLHNSYDIIYGHYTKVCRRRLRKFGAQEVVISNEGTPADVVAFYRKHYAIKYPKIGPTVYERLLESANMCFQKNLAKVYLAKMADGEVCAAYIILFDNNFLYLLVGGSSPAGKRTGSFYLITDAVIKDHAGSGRMLRFEGSDIPGIALFNAQFGAYRSAYQHLNRNALPFPINLFKKV